MNWHYIRLYLLIGVLIAAALILIGLIYFPNQGIGLTRFHDLGGHVG